MRTFGAPRPWMVAVALATASFAGCSKSGSVPVKETGAAAPCEPNTVYGPPICRTDEDCREAHGKGWVCGSEPLRFDDGCGHEIEGGRGCGPGPGSSAAPGNAPAPAAPSAPLPTRGVGPAEE
jgi:hypothetical protein